MHMASSRRVAAIGASLSLAALLGGGCFFNFDRDGELQPGDVTGRALRPSESGSEVVAPFARVAVDGTGRVVRADEDGTFLVRGLPPGGWTTRLVDDLDGDGWPDLTAQRSFSISVQPHPAGLFGSEPEPRATFALLGDVQLSGPGELTGRVLRENGDPSVGARVVVYRSVDVPEATVDGAGTTRASYSADEGVEAETATGADGRFSFEAVAAGDVYVVAMRQEVDTLFMSPPAEVEVREGETTDTGDLNLTNGVPLRQVQIELAPAPAAGETVHVQFVRPGDRVQLFNQANFPTAGTFPGGPSVVVEAPIGEWDVWVQTSSGAYGTLYGRLADRPGRDLVIWGLVRLSTLDPCVGEDDDGNEIRDCDADGLQGLPPLADYNDPLLRVWQGCVDACEDAFGPTGASLTCTFEGDVYDCDDDGDGQSDVTEDLYCYGPGGGSDWDGDGLCGPNDPYPQCASNDPDDEACGAERPDTNTPPPPRPEYTGQPRPDAGPPPTDAGTDSGPPDVDAGSDGGPPETDSGPGGTDAGFDAGFDAGYDAGYDAGPPIVFDSRAQDGTFAFALEPVGDVNVVGAQAVGSTGDAGFVVAGEFTGDVDLYGCTLSSPTPSAFIARYSADGACVWVTTLAGEATDAGTGTFSLSAIGPNHTGSGVVATGSLDGTLQVTVPGGATTSVSATSGLYLLLIDADGAVSFADAFSTDGALTPTHVTTSYEDAILLAGVLDGTTSLPGVEGADIPLDASGDDNPFVTSWSLGNGWFDWVDVFDGTQSATTSDLHFDTQQGGLYLQGVFSGTLSYGDAQTIVAASESVFVASLGSGGQVNWVNKLEGAHPLGHGLAVFSGESSFVLVGGGATGDLVIDGVIDGTTGSSQAFVAVLNGNSGARADVFLFPHDDGASSAGMVRAIDVRYDRSFRVIGEFSSTIRAPGQSGDVTLTAGGAVNTFIYHFATPSSSTDVEFVARWGAGSDGDAEPRFATVLADDSTVVAGDLLGPTDFGDHSLNPEVGTWPFFWRVLFNGQSGDRVCQSADDCPAGVCGPGGLCTPSCADKRSVCDVGDFCDESVGLCEPELDTRVWLSDQWAFDGEGGWSGPAAAAPGARAGFAMQNNGSATLVFGGRDDGDVLRADTWRRASGSWAEVTTTGAPSGRELMAHTTGAGADLWLFGGWDGGAPSDELWRYDDGTEAWTEVTPAADAGTGAWPPARWDAAMAAVGSDLWLFGGVDAQGVVLSDLWRFDGTSWSQPVINDPNFSAPGPLHGHAMHSDPDGSYFVIAGGLDNFGFESSATFRVVAGQPDPEWAFADYGLDGRAYAPMTYDPGYAGLVIAGGANGGAPLNTTQFRYIGSWDPSFSEPWPARSAFGFVYDSFELGLLVYGGYGASLRWVGAARADQQELAIPIGAGWSATTPSAGPPALAGAAYTTVFEQGQDPRFVVFGGIEPSTGVRSNTVWEWTGGTWVRADDPMDATPWPSPRDGASLTYDPCTGNVVLFGGEDDTGLRRDLWTWDGTTWVEDLVEGSWPSSRRGAVFSFVPTASEGLLCPLSAPNQALLYGGESASGMLTDVFLLNLATLGQQGSPWGTPQAFSTPWAATEIAFAPVTDPEPGVLLYGGWDSFGGGYITGDTWLWRRSSSSFGQEYPVTWPGPRSGAAMTTHPTTGAAVLVGGSEFVRDGISGLLGDTFLYTGNDWVEQTVAGDAPARHGAALGASADRLLLVGGATHPNTSPPSP